MARRHAEDILDAVLGAPDEGRTMGAMVAQRLRTAIIFGQLPPGTPLRLAHISERLGVSVMPVRDALRQLELERLVDITPRRGAIVTDLSIEDAEETYAVRVALEALAARHAVTKLTNADLLEIREAFDGMAEAQRSDDLRAFIDADHVFHSRLYKASHRDRLIRNISDLVDRSRRYIPYTYRSWQPLEAGLDAHRPLLEAIEARDPDLVGRLTFDHMVAAAARLVSALQTEADELARAGSSRRHREGGGIGGADGGAGGLNGPEQRDGR